MALQLGALRDELLDDGRQPDKASAAAEELAAYDCSLTDIRAGLTEVRSDLRQLKPMVGMLYPLLLAILAKLFIH